MRKAIWVLVLALLLQPAAASGFGVGATFPYPVYAAWAAAYNRATGIGLNYQSIGSGGGIAQIEAGTVTFGASDIPLTQDELAAHGLVQFPTVVGAVVPVVNLKAVAPGRLVLSGPVLADIFRGKIRRWNDAEIRALNPSLALPDVAIALIVRSDKSGTTNSFSSYLSRFYAGWRKTFGVGIAVNWPAGAIGARGTEGVANHVVHTYGSIGYVEYAYAKQNRLAFVRLINRDGRTVSPGIGTISAAAGRADWSTGTVDLLDRPGADAWPITAPTYVLMRKKPVRSAEAASVLAFFRWAFDHGDGIAEKLDYMPLPPAAKSRVREKFNVIQ